MNLRGYSMNRTWWFFLALTMVVSMPTPSFTKSETSVADALKNMQDNKPVCTGMHLIKKDEKEKKLDCQKEQKKKG